MTAKIDPQKLRLALKQMALEAEVERESDEEKLSILSPLRPQLEQRLVRLADHGKPPTQDFVPALAPADKSRPRRSESTSSSRWQWLREPRWLLWGAPGLVAALVVAIIVLRYLPPGASPADSPKEYAIIEHLNILPSSADRVTLANDGIVGQEVRVLRKHRNETLSLEFKPRHANRAADHVYAFIRQPGKAIRLWEVQPILEVQGVFVLSVAIRELSELEAEQDLLFVFGPSSTLPDPTVLTKTPPPRGYEVDPLHLTLLD